MPRRRWLYTSGGNPLPEPVEVPEDFQSTHGRTAPVTDLYMDGVRATDGTDIGSRAKRREYMQRNGLADASDYTETWARAEKQREAFYAGKTDTQARREAIRLALESRRRK